MRSGAADRRFPVLRRGSIVLALFALASSARSQDAIDLDLHLDDELTVSSSDDRQARRLERLQPRQNHAFGDGEDLVFSVRYGIIRAGEARLKVNPRVTVSGRPCYHLEATAISNDFFSSVFRVNDRMDSWVDREFLLPWRFSKELEEGGYRAQQRIELDQVNQVATYNDGRTFPMDPEAQDVLSALYYLRTLDLSPGLNLLFRTHADRKNVDLAIDVLGREHVSTPAGDFDCLVVEPKILMDTGLYDSKKGKLKIYLTDDERKLPVQFKIKVFFGSIVLTLTDLSEGRHQNGSVP